MPLWSQYLEEFHRDRAGVTERVLERSIAGHHTPQKWLARAISARSQTILDISPGSSLMAAELSEPGRRIIGLGISLSELERASEQYDGVWLLADPLRIPLADNSVDAVVSTLGLAMVYPTEMFLSEIARVLRPGGVMAGLLPTTRPLSASDLKVVLPLTTRLRGVPQFPTTIELATSRLLAEAGLRKLEDQRERYHFSVTSEEDADLFLSALYLPKTKPRRLAAAQKWLNEQVQENGEVKVPIPLRRLVAIKSLFQGDSAETTQNDEASAPSESDGSPSSSTATSGE